MFAQEADPRAADRPGEAQLLPGQESTV